MSKRYYEDLPRFEALPIGAQFVLHTDRFWEPYTKVDEVSATKGDLQVELDKDRLCSPEFIVRRTLSNGRIQYFKAKDPASGIVEKSFSKNEAEVFRPHYSYSYWQLYGPRMGGWEIEILTRGYDNNSSR